MMQSNNNVQIQTIGIQWPQQISNEPQVHEVNPTGRTPSNIESQTETTSDLTLEGKAIQLGRLLQNKIQTNETQKVTIYLPTELCRVLALLKKQQVIGSFSQTVKEALNQYLTR